MDEHKKYLADRLLSEEQPVTYRLLSRALDVHVNTAKEMLYDFHKYQNALRADSVYATYLVYGTRSPDSVRDDDDVEMSSSMPEHEPLSEEVPTTTLTLVAEDNLKAVLSEYQEVTSLHIYSLGPHPQRDLTLLSDVSKSLSEYSAKEDPSTAAQKYGTIINRGVRRRNRQGRPRMPATDARQPVKQEPAAAKPTPAAKVKQEAAETASKDTTPASSAGKGIAPPLKRGSSGGIMQSFAKAASKPQKPKPAVKQEESSMALSDDGEADEADVAPRKRAAADPDAIRRARKAREDELRRMMEEDDEEEEEDDDAEEKEDEPADEEMEEAQEPEPEPEAKGEKTEKEPAEVVSSSGDGRRRGKRRVMKKKRVVDDQGYMVTIQEPGWESFSEDEAPQATKKAAATATPSSSAGSKTKKPAGNAGQGNIMSFFGKK